MMLADENRSKVNVTHTTGHESPQGKQTSSSTLSLTSELDGVGGQRHDPAALPPGKTRTGTAEVKAHPRKGHEGPKRE